MVETLSKTVTYMLEEANTSVVFYEIVNNVRRGTSTEHKIPCLNYRGMK